MHLYFSFFVVSIIYSIHLIHLGSRKLVQNTNKLNISDLVKRADIIDRNGTYLAKTVSSIDIGINQLKLSTKKLLLNLN